MMFDCGAFTTITPRLVAASTSTLSSPMPPGHHLQVRGRAQDLLGDLRGAADDQGVVRLDLSRRGLPPPVEAHVDLEVLAQQVQPGVRAVFP